MGVAQDPVVEGQARRGQPPRVGGHAETHNHHIGGDHAAVGQDDPLHAVRPVDLHDGQAAAEIHTVGTVEFGDGVPHLGAQHPAEG